jgi:nitrogenase-stabilizing/protective protein
MDSKLKQAVDQLQGAEAFCDFFEVDYDQQLLQSKRIPLLRLYHHILESMQAEHSFEDYQKALRVAYRQIEQGNELAFNPTHCDGCSDCD